MNNTYESLSPLPLLSAKSKANFLQQLSDSYVQSMPIRCLSERVLQSTFDSKPIRSPMLSPSQIESRERLKHLNFSKFNKKEARLQIFKFEKKLKEKLVKESEGQLKRFESHGLFPQELNKLRQETLQEVNLHKQLSIFKKQAIFRNKTRLENAANAQVSAEDRKIDRIKLRKKLLEDFQLRITHQQSKPLTTQPESQELDILGELAKLVTEQGLEKYKAITETKKNFAFKSCNFYSP